MPQLAEYISLLLLRLYIGARYYQVVDIQLSITHSESCSTESCDVILEGNELRSDLLRLLAESLELLRYGLRTCYVVGLLAREFNHLIHDLVQTPGLQVHSLHDLGISGIYTVVTILIGIGTRIDQYLPVYLI